LYKAIGKIHGYAVLHTVPHGSHRALRFRSGREHPLVDNKKKGTRTGREIFAGDQHHMDSLKKEKT
jgi:hypothetical protein